VRSPPRLLRIASIDFLASVCGKKSFLSTESDTNILQSIYFAYKVGIISSYSNIIFSYLAFVFLLFLPCICFAWIYASPADKSYISNYMWTAANFIIEGRIRPQVVHRCSNVLHNLEWTQFLYPIRPVAKGGHSRLFHPKFSLCPPNFAVSRNFFIKTL